MNNDEFDDSNLDLDDSNFDDFEESKKGSLGGFFKENPTAKVIVVVAVIVVIFGAVILVGGDNEQIGTSLVGPGSDVTSPPGIEEASPEYIEAIQEVNEREVEIAEQTGGSALPTPIDPPVGVLTVPNQEQQAEDPLQRWRRLQEERLEREIQQTEAVQAPAVADDTARLEALQQLAEAMSAQMQAVLETRDNQVSYLSITDPASFEAAQAQDDQGDDVLGEDGLFDDLEEEIIQDVLLPAGEILYAQLLTEANTDAPGPILAQIMSGPLKGNRIIGTFEAQRDYLTLTFSTVVIDGESVGIDAIAIDPKTTLPGFATEVDRHYLKRIFLPAAAAFITGFADAIAESGRTTVTVQGETVATETEDASNDQEVATGISEVGEEISEIIDEEIDDLEPTIRVAVGTPMGILFVQPVVTQDQTL